MSAGQENEFKQGWPLILAAMVGIGLGLGSIPFYTLGVFAPELVRDFGWSFAEVMGGFTVMTLVTAASGPLAGILADRHGVRPVAIGTLVLFSLGFMAFALMNGSLLLYFALWALIAAVGAGTLPATWTRGVAGAFHRHRGIALGLALVGSGVFAIIAKPLVAAGIASVGWRGAYVMLGALPLVIGLPIALTYFRPGNRNPATSATPALDQDGILLGEALRGRKLWTIFAAFILIAFAIGSPIPHMQNILTQGGMAAEDILHLLPMIGLGVIGGRLLGGVLIDRFWAPGVAAALLMFPAAACLLLTGAISYATALAAIVMISLAAGMEVDLMGYLVARYFGMRAYSGLFGTIYVAFMLGAGFGPLLFGHMFDTRGNYDSVLLVATASLVIGALMLLTLGRYRDAKG